MTTLMQMPDGRLIRACFLFLFFNSVSFAFFCARVGQRMKRERERRRRRLFFSFCYEESLRWFLRSLSLSLSFRTCEIESSSASSFFAHRFSTRTNVHNTHPHTTHLRIFFLLFSTLRFEKKTQQSRKSSC